MTTPANLIPAWVDGALRPMDKIAVHRQGLRHPAVSVFVLQGESMLLQQRARGKYHTPGLWANACCTHPLWAEDPAVCASRRLRQELGIAGLAPEWRGRIEYRADVGGGMTEHEVVDLFLAQAPPDLALAPDGSEVMATRWVTAGNLAGEIAARPQDFTPWLRLYMSDHAALLSPSAAI